MFPQLANKYLLGQWVNTVFLGAEMTDRFSGLVVAALLQLASNLRSFSSTIGFGPDFFVTLRIHAQTLSTLDICVNWERGLGPVSLGIIGNFTSLVRLGISILRPPDAFESPQLCDVTAFSMPHLKYLRWTHLNSRIASSQFITLLTNSTFASLHTLEFAMPVQSDQLGPLEPFMKTHRTIQSISWDIPADCQKYALRLDTSATCLKFPGGIEPSAIRAFKNLPSSVRAVSIPGPKAESNTPGLFQFLFALSQSSSTTNPQEIHIALWTEFRWRQLSQKLGPVSDMTATIYGKLFYYSSVLASRGIRIVDKDGYSPTMNYELQNQK
jgi:hypothetical protein